MTNIPLMFWLAPALMLVAIVESLFLWRWNRAYFSRGIVVFRKQTPIPSALYGKLNTAAFTRGLSMADAETLQFHQFNETEFGFREKQKRRFGQRGSGNVIRGFIAVDVYTSSIVIKGILSWTFIALPVCVAAMFVSGPQTESSPPKVVLVALVAVGVGMFYAMQLAGFKQLAKSIFESLQDTAGRS